MSNISNEFGSIFVQDKNTGIILDRINQIEELKKSFDCILEGRSGLAVITGPPGIGKSFLVERVINEFSNNSVTYIRGKFRPNNKNSFIAISDIVEQIVKHILTLPSEQVDIIKTSLCEDFKENIGIIIAISPYAEKLLGQHKIITMDYSDKMKQKVERILHRFLLIASEYLYPLIVFIDDLQWADSATLGLIASICENREELNFLLVLSYRDNKEEFTLKMQHHEFFTQNKEDYYFLKLEELSVQSIIEYLEIVLDDKSEEIDYIAKVVHRLTRGNPYYVKEVLNILEKENVFNYSKSNSAYEVNITKISQLKLPKGIEEIITLELSKVGVEEKELLELISCFDGRVDLNLLRKVVTIGEERLTELLDNLVDAMFLVKVVEHFGVEENIHYELGHDLIIEIIYQNIPAEVKYNHHLNISKMLISEEEEFIGSNTLFVTSQLLRVSEEVLIKDNAKKWVHQLYKAGVETKKTSNTKKAYEIFKYALKVFMNAKFDDVDRIELAINLEIGECEFICKRDEEAKNRFEMLINTYSTSTDLVTIKRKYMNLYRYSGESRKVIELGMEILSHLDFKFGSEDFKVDIFKERFILRNIKLEKIARKPVITDKRINLIIETLVKMAPSANLANDKIFKSILIKVGLLSAQYGRSSHELIGYAAYSIILQSFWKDFKEGEKVLKVILDLIREESNHETKCVVYFLIGTFIDHNTNPLKKSIYYLEKSIEEGLKVGELLYSGYSITSIIKTKYMMGVPLNDLMSYISMMKKDERWIGQDTVKDMCETYEKHIYDLRYGCDPKDLRLVSDVQPPVDIMETSVLGLEIVYCYFVGENELAYTLVCNCINSLELLKGHTIYVDRLFFNVLVRLSYHESLNLIEQKDNKQKIEKYIKEVKNSIKIYEGNHKGIYLLLVAEYQKLFQKNKFRQNVYSEIIKLAEESGHLQLLGITNLIAAKYNSNNKKLSQFYAKESIIALDEWGADYICENLKLEFELSHEQLLSLEPGKVDSNHKSHRSRASDKAILNFINDCENMNENESFMHVLDVVSENMNIEYCAMLTEQKDEMFLEYEKKKGESPLTYIEMKNIKHVSYLSRKIIRYVARTGEEVILNNKPQGGIFAKDIYIMEKDEISISCIPIKYMDILIGVLYLETDRFNHFDEEMLTIIKNVLPTLINKKKTIKDINIHSLLNPNTMESPLTKREQEILNLIAKGMANTEICNTLFITLGTVKTHVSNIYSKLEVDNRIKAVLKAKEMNILNL